MSMEVEVRKRMRIDLDKLPIKRLHAIDEIGNEQFPPEKSKEEERLSAIRRIDFSSVVEKEKRKKEKESKEEEEAQKSKETTPTWQGLTENLQQAQRELTVILDLISIVEANDAVAVAGMQRPKQLPTETLADFAVSAATKLQRLRHLGRYFKQSSKTMEQQVVKEARFYGSLIRLQQNWKVKRQRVAGPGSGNNEGFSFELHDTSLSSSLSTIRIDQDKSGVLSIQLPQKARRFLSLRFLGDDCSSPAEKKVNVSKKECLNEEDLNGGVKSTHSVLRSIHRAIFEERVFELVNRETYDNRSSKVINVTGMREDLLQLVIGQDSSLCLSLVEEREKEREEREKEKDESQTVDSYNEDSESSSSSALLQIEDKNVVSRNRDPKSGIPKPVSSLEIYLLSLFHSNSISKSNSGGLLGHFCMTVAHRLFSSKVLTVLESLVSRVPYLELISHPTWHSRTSSWSLCIKVPEKGTFHKSQQGRKGRSKMETKVVVMDGQISLKGENCATIIASFSGNNNNGGGENYTMNSYSCDLDDLPMLLLQQVASQVIHWLHEESLMLGLHSTIDFLCLNLELNQGETLSLAAQVDPDDPSSCISWWLVMVDNMAIEDTKFESKNEFENRRLLGSLSLKSLYAVLMDLVSLSRVAV
ncbi:hypothetical protein LUZ60_013572 [Juncus effusus]|nr:hypothetical protein LUZ60_013572 [Juncus effusus]